MRHERGRYWQHSAVLSMREIVSATRARVISSQPAPPISDAVISAALEGSNLTKENYDSLMKVDE
jgi:hypothetical protein